MILLLVAEAWRKIDARGRFAIKDQGTRAAAPSAFGYNGIVRRE
jgi:hypothetical protein